MRQKLTKLDKVKVILTALYKRNHTLTDEEIQSIPVWKRRVNRLLRNNKVKDIDSLYVTALKTFNKGV